MVLPLRPQPHAQQWEPALLGHGREVVSEASKGLNGTWREARGHRETEMDTETGTWEERDMERQGHRYTKVKDIQRRTREERQGYEETGTQIHKEGQGHRDRDAETERDTEAERDRSRDREKKTHPGPKKTEIGNDSETGSWRARSETEQGHSGTREIVTERDTEDNGDPGPNADTEVQNQPEPKAEPGAGEQPSAEPPTSRLPGPWAPTNLEVGVGSQRLVDQSVALWVAWTQVHDVALGFFIRQGHRWELARSGRNWD